MYKLILVRHGESVWNKENRFTGWTDVDLSERGEEKARRAGGLIKKHDLFLFLLFPARQPVEQHHCQNNDTDDEDDADHPDQHHRQRGHPRSKMKHAITSVKPSGSGSCLLVG